MNHFRTYPIVLAAALLLAAGAPAQTILTPTTLSTAISDSGGQVMTVASVTTVTGYSVVAGTGVYIDKEYMTVKPLNGLVSGTTLAVIRGQGGTVSAPHASGALVFFGPPNAFYSKTALEPQGSCTRSSQIYLPYINVRVGQISDCLGGQWVNAAGTAARWRVYAPEPGAVAYTSINTAGTQVSNTTLYCTEVDLPGSKLLTGIALLNGTTVTTDLQYVILFDSAGNKLANSNLTGVVTGTASVYQARAFTAPFFAVGPAQYFACFQSSAGTDTIRMTVTGTNDNLLTKGQTGATYGTIPTFSPPTAFASAVGPYVYLY